MEKLRIIAQELRTKSYQGVLDELDVYFKEADESQNGEATLSNLVRSLRNHGYRCDLTELAGIFHLENVSATQTVTFEDYMKGMKQAPHSMHSEASMRKAFCVFDKDNNGSIETSELRSVLREMHCDMSEEECRHMLTLADKDQSGTIEYDEFINAILSLCTID